MHGYQENLLQNSDADAAGFVPPEIAPCPTPLVGSHCEPVVFDGCFGWYHPGRTQLGVVLCGPHGYEELCVHRHWREFAQALARQDLPTLRFDYPGTGDSADNDEDPDRVQAWVESIRQAADTLRRVAGVDRIALVGLRMGAMLALEAAAAIDDLAALVLLAPIGSGETCFRELRALAMMRAPARHRQSATVTDAGLEAAGFVYTSQTIADLRRLPRPQGNRPPAREILLLHRPNAVADRDLQVRLAACGVAVEEASFDDYPLLLRNADLSAYPNHGFGHVVQWLAARRGTTRQAAPAMTRLTVLRLPDVEEKPIFLSRAPDLFGVLCKPYGVARNAAVVFLNTGLNHHIGTSRMTVSMARRLAGLGFASLRLDICGVGDSDGRPGRSADPTVDVSAALDGLRDRGYDEFILIGLCSGAKLALETTLRDARVVGQILLNLQGYWQTPSDVKNYVSRRAYFRMARQMSTWKRVAKGRVDITGISRAIVQRSIQAVGHNIAEAWGTIWRRDSPRGVAVGQFRSLAARDVQTRLVFVEEDPGLDEMEVVLGRGGQMLKGVPNVAIEILTEGDHIFSWDYSRRQLFSVVEATIETIAARKA